MNGEHTNPVEPQTSNEQLANEYIRKNPHSLGNQSRVNIVGFAQWLDKRSAVETTAKLEELLRDVAANGKRNWSIAAHRQLVRMGLVGSPEEPRETADASELQRLLELRNAALDAWEVRFPEYVWRVTEGKVDLRIRPVEPRETTVSLATYESAVKGRSDFRQAYRQARSLLRQFIAAWEGQPNHENMDRLCEVARGIAGSPEEPTGVLPPAFQSLLDLQPNWDSYGAKRINPACVQKAYEIWRQLAGIWLPVPHSDGTVGLEQHQGGFDIEIDVDLSLPPEKSSESSPDQLVGALQDRVHQDLGRVRAGRSVKASGEHVHEWHPLPRGVNFCVTCDAVFKPLFGVDLAPGESRSGWMCTKHGVINGPDCDKCKQGSEEPKHGV